MTSQTPGGPGPPCCMGVGLGDSVPVDFHEEKIGTFSGSPGAKLPAAFLLPFVAEDKRKWPRSRYLFWVGLRSLCADKPQQKSGLSATFFLHTKKEGKDVPRGFPLGAPGGFVDFLSMKIDSDAGPSSRPYKKGCGPGDGLPHFFSPAPNRSPEASASLVV